MCTHLSRRGARYYIRRVVPTDLIAHLGRREIVKSLGTSERREGERLCRLETVKLDHLFDVARQELKSMPLSEGVTAGHPDTSALFDYDRWSERAREQEVDAAEAAYDAREPLREALRDLEREREERVGVASESLAHPAKSVADRSVLSKSKGGMLLGEVIDQWALERKPVAKTVAAHVALGRWFYDSVGKLPVQDITAQDVLAFKANLVATGVTIPNIKTKLSRLRTLLNFAKDNGIITINPADGVKVIDTVSARHKRREFDAPALAAIFGSPVYSEDARPHRGRGEAAYWLPLLALYTGARLNELGQLRPKDVVCQGYLGDGDIELSAWVIRIVADDADGMRLKNAGSERIIPIHSVLEGLGFLRFVEAARNSGAERIFPDLKPNKFGNVTAKWSDWFGPYLRDVCGVTDRRMVFHSFRHSFKHHARHVAMIEGVQRAIMGHESGDVADDYGSGYGLHQLVEGMKRYRVPGLRLPQPPPGLRGPVPT